MLLMLGISPVVFARTTRIANLRSSKKGPKGLTPSSPISDVFRERLLGKGDVMLTLDTVEGLLQAGEVASTSLVPNGAPRDQMVLRRQWNKSHKLTVLQLLSTLRDAMAAEEHMLRFDYFAFHLRCLKVQKSVQRAVDDKLRQYFGPRYIENDTQLPFALAYIIQVAGETEKFGERVKSKDGFKSLIMARASDTIEEFIPLEGEVECDKLERTCLSWSRKEVIDAVPEGTRLSLGNGTLQAGDV
jgi:hypothetical protein